MYIAHQHHANINPDQEHHGAKTEGENQEADQSADQSNQGKQCCCRATNLLDMFILQTCTCRFTPDFGILNGKIEFITL